MGVQTSTLLLGVGLVGLALYIICRPRRAPLPPGPPGWLLIGNLFDLRRPAPYKALGAMASEYGPIVSLRAFGAQYIVLNSFETTRDLLEKKSVITSGRPHFVVAGDHVGWGNATPFLQHGDTHRKHRKFFGQHIRSNDSLMAFYPAGESEARRFVLNALKNPDNLGAHCQTTIASLIWKISHGYSVKDEDDPLVEMANNAMRNLSEVTAPGRFLVDFLPILQYLPEWLPGGTFRKSAKQWRKMVDDAVNAPYQFVLEHLASGDAVPSFTSRLLQDGVSPEDETILKWATFGMYLAGSDTVPSMLIAFFLAMTMHPEIFKKAQVEVDTVVGHDRLPIMEDRNTLPYVNAICLELLRWNVFIPFPSHVCTQDIIYQGYLIPKGSYIFANIWHILSDPATYPNPEAFDPQRFLGERQQPDPREACFGWGRRVCLGARLAETIIFIYVATLLATLDVSRCVENGVECVPRYDFEEGMLRRLKPFKCKIVPRSKDVEDRLHGHVC